MNIKDFLLNIDDLEKLCIFSENHINKYKIDRSILSIENNNITLSIVDNIYKFTLIRDRFTVNKYLIVICSKNNSEILLHSLNKLYDSNNIDQFDVLLVDDRSNDESILNISDRFNTSYLRIDNDQNIFNYSAINNLAAAYAKNRKKELIIFYNNDLWPTTSTTLLNLVSKHISYESTITGCKLLYPTKTDYETLGKPQHLLQKHLDYIYNTIQHGGIFFIPKNSMIVDNNRKFLSPSISMSPLHLWRFYPENTIIANMDNRCFSVTGALQIISVKDFWTYGGFNMGMSTAFQDIDLCVRIAQSGGSVYYIGSEAMFHAESITVVKERKQDNMELVSDNLFWDLIWSTTLPNIIGYQL